MGPRPEKDRAADPVHPVRLVSFRTGLSPHVLRVWERRYGAVHPVRTNGGQRLYTDSDVQRLLLLRDASRAGRGIAQLVGLPNEALRALIANDRQHKAETQPPAPAVPSAADVEPEQVLQACLDAVGELDSERLTAQLRRATVHLPLESFTDRVVAPLLTEIGVRWMQGHLGPSLEHAASVVVHSVLSDVMRSLTPSPGGPAIVVATPMGQQHELGALLAAVCAANAGWRVTYLGADLPATEIARAADKVGADVVALSIMHPASDPQLRDDLQSLADLLPPGRQLVVGGSCAGAYAHHLNLGGMLELDLASFRVFLSRRATANT